MSTGDMTPAVRTELFVDFRSYEEWTQWRQTHFPHFSRWRSDIIRTVTQAGLIEPIARIRRLPAEITINEQNFRESISSAELNSRKRAALLYLEQIFLDRAMGLGRSAKVLAAEGLTRAASILRGTNPFFLGCEYLPTSAEKERFFPIPHLDLQAIDCPDSVFDIFYSSDVLEHVPDLARSMTEILRVLRPGGLIVSVFPFLADRLSTIVKAQIGPDGSVIHLMEPEYHGNPVRPEEGSLVFSLPGWDFLQSSKEIGFADAKMTLIASSTFGITANNEPGVMVFTAIKGAVNESAVLARIRKYKTKSEQAYSGPAISKVVAIAALPRSGTTVLTSILGVHSRVRSVFEPWNAAKNKIDVSRATCLSAFIADFHVDMENHDVLVVKETAADPRYIDRLEELLSSVRYPLERDLVVLLRNPLHVFLSEIQARKEWWGEAGLQLTPDIFGRWADRTLRALARLKDLAISNDGIVLSYEALTRDPLVKVKLMNLLSLSYEAQQSSYEEHVDTAAVRGDMGLAKSPRPLSGDSVERRAAQLESLTAEIKESGQYLRTRAIADLFDQFTGTGVCRAHDIGPLLRELQKELVFK